MSLILSGVFNCLHLVTVIICFLIIDKVGRRPLAIFGGFAMGACYIIVTVLSTLYGPDWTNTSAGWACVAMAFLFILIFGNTYSPLGWALPSEVFPNAIRSKGVAIFFAVWCVLAGVWAFFLVPETSGKTLEQIDEVFGDITSQEESKIMREATSAATFGGGNPDV